MFNPESRWDRNLPQGNVETRRAVSLPENGLINEYISMTCLFAKGKALPRYFIWRKRLYRVKKVNFFWQERQGRATLSYFALETNSGTYQVSFSNIDLSWKMDKIIST